MEELLNGKEHIPLKDASHLVLIDTCFLIHNSVRHDKLKQLLKTEKLALTSFNVEEVLYVERRLSHDEKHALREFFKKADFVIVDVDVHPGDRESEKKFVDSIDVELLENIPDPSDAVLMAVALQTHSDVLTKDKHHLFTVTLENYIQEHGIKVFKDMHSYSSR